MEQEEAEKLTHKVHTTLAHSYLNYFIFLVIGVVLDILFPFRIFKDPTVVYGGLVLLGLSTALIFWAQHTTRGLHDNENLESHHFSHGPYTFTRMPTHWGLFLLTLGFGIVANAFFVVVTTILSFILSKSIFLKKYENTLVEKYGSSYAEYKKSVKL